VIKFRSFTVLTALLAVCATGANASSFSEIVVFGDSLSDHGNIQKASSESELLPAVPPANYHEGRFSNGRVWTDVLGDEMGFDEIQPSRAGGLNYAHGAAQSIDGTSELPEVPFSSPPIVRNLGKQVTHYLDGDSAEPSGSALNVVYAGANDFLLASAPEPPTVAAGNVKANLKRLYEAGARKFLVPNLPPLGMTPAVIDRGPQAVEQANDWTSDYNETLEQALTNLEQQHGDIQIARVDVAGLFRETDFEKLGITVTDQGYTSLVNPGYKDNPAGVESEEQYLFWDAQHPTKKIHQQIGLRAAEAAAALPEPATALSLAIAGGVVLCRGRASRS